MLPDGNLWEVTPAGTLVHQVAIGYPNASMSAWRPTATLLYLAGHDLYVSQDGNTPSKLATGLIAATWM